MTAEISDEEIAIIRARIAAQLDLPENDSAVEAALEIVVTAVLQARQADELRELLKDDKPMTNPRKQYIMDKTAPIRRDMNRNISIQPRRVIALTLCAYVLGAAISVILPLWATAVLGLALGILLVARYVGKFERDRKAEIAATATANASIKR